MARTVLVTDYAWPSLAIEREILASAHAELLVAETGEAEELIELAPEADAVLTCWKRVPSAALEAAASCLVVSRYGVGLDNIPVADATRLGILVTNVPDFCVEEVSDHAMALVLACARRIVAFAGSTRAGRWDLGMGAGLPRIRGQTLGLVGYGAIARALVPKARGFGLNVLAFTPRLQPGPLSDGAVATNDLGELLEASDYVSVHAPATAETVGLIGVDELGRMKSTAYLINTSRGALVDERALEEALRSGGIAGAALDVLATEPPSSDHAVLALDNVIVTPHAAFYSEEAIRELATKAARNVADVLSGRLPRTVVNREVLDRSVCRFATAGGGHGR